MRIPGLVYFVIFVYFVVMFLRFSLQCLAVFAHLSGFCEKWSWLLPSGEIRKDLRRGKCHPHHAWTHMRPQHK